MQKYKVCIKQNLKVLRENKLYAKISKYVFLPLILNCFGHVISNEGISVHPRIVKVVVEWPKPNDKTEVKSF